MEKQAQLDKLAKTIVAAKVCNNLAAQAKQLVFGDGNPDADVVFIGEAPGQQEDERGKPFVGRAGQFLDDMLELAHLNRKDVYITNIVKYRPPDNRDPLPEEKTEFLPYLYKQIAIIQPKLVVTLGRHSMEAFLPGLRISQVHGRAFSSVGRNDTVSVELPSQNNEPDSLAGFGEGVIILPLYHPAAALYNGGLRQTLVEDFNKIPKILEKNLKFNNNKKGPLN